MQRLAVGLLALPLLFGCKDPPSGDTDPGSGTGSGSTSITSISATEPTTDVGTTAEPATTGSTGTTDEPTTGPVGPCAPIECNGDINACGDCMDNDGDGRVDSADPECVTPCDDREDTFATGLPGDNMDPCKQDCFFDGNSGGGAGDCAWNLACDPKGPGGDKCPYNPDQNNCPEEQSEECVTTCQVPNGCDCFGCCTVEVDGVEVDIFLGDEDCSIAAIDQCEQCTPNEDCDEECHPEECEVCFGQELPPGCDEPACENDMPCVVDELGGSNCPGGTYCNTGCCVSIVG